MTSTDSGAFRGMELFRRAESDLALFEPAIHDYSLWPALRFSAWQLVSGVRTGTAAGRSRVVQRRAERLLGLATYGLWSLAQRRRLRRKHFEFAFVSQESHRVATPRGWWDLYLDDIAEHSSLAGRVLRIERRDFPIARRRTVAARHLFEDLQRLEGGMARSRAAMNVADAACDIFFQRLRECDAALSTEAETRLRSYARLSASRFHDELSWYDRFWSEFRPAVVALIDAYNQHGLVAAAKQNGIPVVEFQHGNIHPDHPGYIWFATAQEVRARLAIPDRIATFGSYWSDVLLQEGFWSRDEVPAVGSVRIDRVRSAPRRHEGSTLRILFTSQFATRSRTIPLLVEFIGLAGQGHLDYTLAIKVHRGERNLMHEYEALCALSPRVSVVSPYADDTLAMIAAADVHVSAWSTCHYEAVALGTPTIVLVFPGPDRVEGLKEFSLVTRAESAAQLLQQVRLVSPRAAQNDESSRHESD